MWTFADANHDTNHRNALSESPTETPDIKGSETHSGTRSLQKSESSCSAPDAEDGGVPIMTPEGHKDGGSLAIRTTSTGGEDDSSTPAPTPKNVLLRRERRLLGRASSSAVPQYVQKLASDQSELFQFMHMVNEIYQTHLKKQPPFARFILLGLQSTGKSTVVERLIKFPMNIVAEGTGTRCPLYVTCINDPKRKEPTCEITGCEKCERHGKLSHQTVFDIVTKHNQDHIVGSFSATPLRLSVQSASVQNLIFVDLPGIIITQGQGEDTRDGIKKILRQEMEIANTKLLILLEPKEFATNSIISFVDDTVGSRDDWLPRAIFMMTKFDLRTSDSLTGSKSNRFFKEFWDNGVKPYLVITPTMQRAADTFDSPDEQYKERQHLLNESDTFEKDKFSEWREQIKQNYRLDNRNELLGVGDQPYSEYIGFKVATTEMFNRILADTIERLPDVVKEITDRLQDAHTELALLKAAEKFTDPSKAQASVAEVLHHLVTNILQYLDGSLRIAKKMQEAHQTLEDEINEEEDSEWCRRPLNHLCAEEEKWRDHICDMFERNEWPEHVQPFDKYLGGKQYQRAILFFKAVMQDRLPTPHELEPFVASATGALRDGLMMENWEHATVEIIKECVRGVTQEGINFFVKHAMIIFRRLIHVALADAKVGEECSSLVKVMPRHVQDFICAKYDDMVWKLGTEAAKMCQHAIKPYYSTVNPSLQAKNSGTMPLKRDWALYMQVLKTQGVVKLYHRTDTRNVESIRQMGGLFSRAYLRSHGITYFAPNDEPYGGDGLDEFVHLSFTPHDVTCIKAQEENHIGDCALLEIDPIVVTWRETEFSDGNVHVHGHQRGASLHNLKRVNFDSAKMTRDNKDFGNSYNQAAVFVLDRIPIQHITVQQNALPREVSLVEKVRSKKRIALKCSVSESAKKRMKSDYAARSLKPTQFLPGARCQLINKDEVNCILEKSYEYIITLYDHVLTCLDFHFNDYLFQGFKEKLRKEFDQCFFLVWRGKSCYALTSAWETIQVVKVGWRFLVSVCEYKI